MGINPAGIGMYREVTLEVDFQSLETKSVAGKGIDSDTGIKIFD